ncbi:MAG: phytanoyl-CoA dioxygenase family protein [Verrucomicrobia bacterium]|nr:phytanoyl-CoA dioxygenase family protein [Verrucomicrobiota bacterium]
MTTMPIETLTPKAASRSTIVESDQALLTPEQIASFEENGYLHVPGVVSAEELAILRADADRITAIPSNDQITNSDYGYIRPPHLGRAVLHRIGYMQTKTDAFLHLLGHPVILRIAEALQGRNMVCGVGFSMVTKSKGYGAAVPWHVDPAFCKVRNGINIGIYLDGANESNGMLWAVPGSHRRKDYDLQELIEKHGFRLPGAIPVPTQAGDLVIHSEDVLHGSPVTHSDEPRRVVYCGVRTIEEQLARGVDFASNRAIFRALTRAIQARATSPIGRGETPFQQNPSFPECRVSVAPDDFIELRVSG